MENARKIARNFGRCRVKASRFVVSAFSDPEKNIYEALSVGGNALKVMESRLSLYIINESSFSFMNV